MKNIIQSVLFVANGRSKKILKIERALLRAFFPDYKFIKTRFAGEVEAIVHKNYQSYDLIVAVGGDGTIHELVNAIMSLPKDISKPLLTAIPAGTANDFSKSLNLPKSIPQLLSAITSHSIFKSDVGEIHYLTANGVQEKRYFINIADAGIGAVVVEEVNQNPSPWGANITFFKAITAAFRKYKNLEVKCSSDEWEWKGLMKMVVIANGSTFGSGLIIAPDAKLNDGKFSIIIGGDISTYDYIKYLPQLKRGSRIDHPQLFYKEASHISILSKEKCRIEADGEFLGFTPLKIKVLKESVSFLTCSGD